jgi:Up-regulated During Septation
MTVDIEMFPILSLERYIEQKRKLDQHIQMIASLQNKLSMEDNVRDASANILNSSNDPSERDNAKRQLDETSKRMDNTAQKIWLSITKLIDTERTVMKRI